MLGGLARRATAIQQIRKETPHLLLVDAGNSLFAGIQYKTEELPKVRKKADHILNSYLEMGYQAMNIGIRDWVGGGGYLLEKTKEKKYPFISANVIGAEGAEAPVPPFSEVEICGTRVGIIGVMGSEPFPGIPQSTKAADPVTIIRDLVSKLKSRCSILVILSNLSRKMNEEIASQMEGTATLIIESGDGGSLHSPVRNKDVYTCHPAHKGHWLGRFDIDVLSGNKIGPVKHSIITLDESVPEDKKVVAEIDRFLSEGK